MQGPKILGDNDRSLTSAHLRCHDAALYLYATVYQCAVSDFFNKIDCHNKTEIVLSRLYTKLFCLYRANINLTS